MRGRWIPCLAFVLWAVSAHVVRAAASDNVSGWAWNTEAGWVSVNSENCIALNRAMDPDPCALGGRSYGLTIAANGAVTGYAWSETVGWICVGATCAPSGGVTPSGGWVARVNAVTGELTGWAKVLALGDRGILSFSCANTATCGTVAYRTTVNVATGAFAGHAWNGASDGAAFGWIAWQPAFGGVTTTWRPTLACSQSGASCASDIDCVLPGELCCLGGAPCGRCGGAGAACGVHANCTAGTLCCRDGVQCGRCVGSGAACGSDLDCGGARDSCCPPGALCTGGADGGGGGGDPGGGAGGGGAGGGAGGGEAQGSASPVGACEGSKTSPTLCIAREQCGDVACDAERRICATSGSACSVSDPCGIGDACEADVGICTSNAPAGTPVPCTTDTRCRDATGAKDVTCKKILGKCTERERLCGTDVNCGAGGGACGKLFLPWLETTYGSIASSGSVGSARTAPPPSGRYNATYCLIAGGRIVNVISASPSCGPKPAYAGAPTFPKGPAYRSARARIDVPAILRGAFGTVERLALPVDPSTPPFSGPLSGKVYLVEDQDLVLGPGTITLRNGVSTTSGAGLIVVRGGNLRITGDLAFDDASVTRIGQLASPGFLVLTKVGRDAEGQPTEVGGSIIIDRTVTRLVGAFYAERDVRTGGGTATDRPLVVRGVMIARRFLFERLAAGTSGAEQVIADGRVLANPPPGFVDFAKALPTIQQSAP